VKFQRRFANIFSFLNAYTWGKAIDVNSDNDGDVSFINVYDIERLHRGPADYDVAHNFSSSWIYELPLAREHWYGGWQVNGILQLRTGLPFTVTQNQGVQSTGTGNRPNRICDRRLDNPTIDRWFDTDQIKLPAQFSFGNLSRTSNSVRSDGIQQIDFSIFKEIKITERVKTQFRAEWFNFTNTPIFDNPATTVGAGSFGRVTSTANSPRQTQLALKILF
jgi:hypothetical protein